RGAPSAGGFSFTNNQTEAHRLAAKRDTESLKTEGVKVLIVDDEEVIRDSFGMALERAGYSVLTAVSGQEGLNLVARQPGIACVVSDIRMPGMDGLELLARLRNE